MPETMDREQLRALLASPNLHDIIDAAHRARRERHGLRTTFVALDHLDLSRGQGRTWSPLSGQPAPTGGFAKNLDGVSERATEIAILLEDGADIERLRQAWAALPPRPDSAPEGELLASVQLATSSQWIEALDGLDAAEVLGGWKGLGVVSDGVRPRAHPAVGEEAGRRWEEFWRAAAAAGIRGNATVLYGPSHDLDSVFEQIDAIARVQADTGVFVSVSPVVHHPEGFGGARDGLATHARFDLQCLAACRLGLVEVEHVRFLYERSDLKTAHTALLCGADDLEGSLHLSGRDRRGDAESDDLSLDEMPRWLEEVGLESYLRNGLYETLPAPVSES